MLARWFNRAKPAGFRPSHLRKNRSGNDGRNKPNSSRKPLLRSDLPLGSADTPQHLFQRLPQYQAALAEKLDFLGPQLDLMPGEAAAVADDGGDAKGDV